MATAFQTDAFQEETKWPDPSVVEVGQQYGPNGNDFIGTLEQMDPQGIADAVWNAQMGSRPVGSFGRFVKTLLTVGKYLGLS